MKFIPRGIRKYFGPKEKFWALRTEDKFLSLVS
jgi:hypothetical protein